MLERRRAVARPRQPEVVAGEVVLLLGHRIDILAALCAQRLHVEDMHHLHMRLQPLRRLSGVADGPGAAIDLVRERVLHRGLVVAAFRLRHPEVLLAVLLSEELILETELSRESQHDRLVGARLEQRIDDLLAPLQRPVRRGARALGLELRRGRQQVHAAPGLLLHAFHGHRRHRGGGRRIRIDDDHHVEHLHRLDHVQAAGLRVRRVAPVDHRADVGILIDVLVLLHHAVDPARDREAGLAHHSRSESVLQPFQVHVPDARPVRPRSGHSHRVVAGQRVGIGADVGCALHVVVAAEDVRPAARDADVAERELQDARRAHYGVADGVLRLSHAPDDGARAVLGKSFRDLQQLLGRHARDVVHFLRRPFLQDFFPDLLHAVDTIVEVFLVFPAVLENDVQHPEQERDIGPRADAHVLVGLGGGARETRIDHDHLRAGFLGVQHMQHRHRMRFGRVRADVHRALGVLHVVVGVGHRAVAPGLGNARDRGRVADARLVVAVVRAPQRHPLAQQHRLLVAVLGGADHVQRVGPGFLADREQPVADLVHRLVPGEALVLAVYQLHRVFQPVRVLGHAVLAH